MTIAIIVIVAALCVGGFAIVSFTRHRRPVDGVATFRRHIDALSPEARREVIDRVQNARDSGKGK
jgi:hypothetical protein